MPRQLTRPQLRRRRTGATEPRKRSPGSRRPEGQLALYGVKNAVPGRHYVWVQPGNANSMATYRASGYVPERWRFETKNGKVNTDTLDGLPKVVGAEPVGAMPEPEENGKPIRIADFVLMSCAKVRKADIDEYGHCGQTGQVMADELEDRLIKHKRGNDPLRGLRNFGRGRHMDVQEYEDGGERHGHTSQG